MPHSTPCLVDTSAMQEAHSTIESVTAMLPSAPARIIVLALARLRDAMVPMPAQAPEEPVAASSSQTEPSA